ncbi:MAG: hypothetical protein M0T73_07815 [Deltaproteobacteria bacterium]|nr:hypothetical protein [Deltaproteobacteria bacterium]
MLAEKLQISSVKSASKAIDSVGSNNSELMASRAIHINLIMRKVLGVDAKSLKKIYNEIGAEVAISRQAYYEEKDAITDMIIMGTVYQHREARRILVDSKNLKPYVDAISEAIENSDEVRAETRE